MNSENSKRAPGRKRSATPRGPTRPPAPDTPELAERRAQAPAAQALIRATRRLLAEGGPEWATDKRIHDTASRPAGRKGFPLGTIRYYFGGRERLLVYVARHEHLTRLDHVRRALRKVNSTQELAATLLKLAGDLDHFQVALGLLTEARQMPELQVAQAQLCEDRLAKLTEMISELQARSIVGAKHDPYALALLWSSLTAGLAAHQIAYPQIELQPALDLAHLYATSLQ
jgi:AcrR family transcriptional regulator